jgi:excinuclease ABC subunit A
MMAGCPAEPSLMNTPADSKYLAQVLGAQRISVRGRAHAQPQEHRPRYPAQPAGGHHRLVGLGQVFAWPFDTLYAEGQRRYVESLSAYARQFLQLMDKPDVDLIEGLSPAIAIEQKAALSHNPRSTVGTVTEIHDYLRLLFARAGTPLLPRSRFTSAGAKRQPRWSTRSCAWPAGTRLMILAPIARDKKGEFTASVCRADARARLRALSRRWPRSYEYNDLPARAEKSRKAQHRRGDRPPARCAMALPTPMGLTGGQVLPPRPSRAMPCASGLAESFEAALALAEGKRGGA